MDYLSMDSKAWLAAIVESSDDAIISKNLDGIITSWNGGASRIFGYDADEMIGESILKVIPQDRQHEEQTILARVRAGERVKQYETIRRTKDGRELHVSLTISPIFDKDHKVIGVSKIARDISEQKRSQEIQGLLLRELNHRSKNLLAVADAIVRQTARSTPPRELVERVSRRLNSLSINQDLLVAHDWRGVEIARIVHAQLHAIIDSYENRVTIEGGTCVVNPRVGQALSLAIYELAANAMKYGSLSIDTGKVEIKWRVDQPDGERMFHMSWREHGGPRVTRPRKRGFGTTISEQMMARSVLGKANIDYANDGLVWQLTAPEAALIEPEKLLP